MSNLEIVKQWYATLDIDRYLAEDVDWEIARSFPEEGRYRGREEVKAMFGRLMANFSDFSVQVEELIAGDGDRVIALGEYRGTTAASGKPFAVPFAHVWTVKDGRIASVLHYPVSGVLDRAMS